MTAHPERRSTPAALTTTVLEEFDESLVTAAEWDKLVESVGGNVYMTFHWCRAWWRHYGDARRLRVYVFRCEQKVVGILPLFTEDIGLGFATCRIAKILGADHTIQLCNPPIQAVHLQDVINHAFADLVGPRCRCDLIVLSPISAGSRGYAELRAAVTKASAALNITDTVVDCHTIFELPTTFESYLHSLAKSARANFKRDSNLLHKSFSVSCDTLSNRTSAEAEYQPFVEMHCEQWRGDGRRGHFQDWPKATEFNLSLLRDLGDLGRVRLYRLALDGEVVSYQYAFHFNHQLAWRLPARVTGVKWSRFGLGRSGLGMLIKSAIEEGVESIEAGQGHYDYKVQMGGVEHEVHSFRAVRRRTGSRVKYALLRFLSAICNAFYYKLLFRRIYPRFPAAGRPLNHLWIRTRL